MLHICCASFDNAPMLLSLKLGIYHVMRFGLKLDGLGGQGENAIGSVFYLLVNAQSRRMRLAFRWGTVRCSARLFAHRFMTSTLNSGSHNSLAFDCIRLVVHRPDDDCTFDSSYCRSYGPCTIWLSMEWLWPLLMAVAIQSFSLIVRM